AAPKGGWGGGGGLGGAATRLRRRARRIRRHSLPPPDYKRAATRDRIRPRRQECAARSMWRRAPALCVLRSFGGRPECSDIDVRTSLRPLGRKRAAGDEVEYRFRDVGGVIADPLDILRAEQKMRAEGNIARVLHHMGEQIAKNRILERVEFGVARPHRLRALDVALRIGVEHV